MMSWNFQIQNSYLLTLAGDSHSNIDSFWTQRWKQIRPHNYNSLIYFASGIEVVYFFGILLELCHYWVHLCMMSLITKYIPKFTSNFKKKSVIWSSFCQRFYNNNNNTFNNYIFTLLNGSILLLFVSIFHIFNCCYCT
jgi:hypothetical protein